MKPQPAVTGKQSSKSTINRFKDQINQAYLSPK
jgi:hypothetical protein